MCTRRGVAIAFESVLLEPMKTVLPFADQYCW